MLGKTLAELRALLLPGELELHQADAELYGPWWEERADWNAAVVRHSLWGADPPPLSDLRVKWNGQPEPMEVLEFEDLARILLPTAQRS